MPTHAQKIHVPVSMVHNVSKQECLTITVYVMPPDLMLYPCPVTVVSFKRSETDNSATFHLYYRNKIYLSQMEQMDC